MMMGSRPRYRHPTARMILRATGYRPEGAIAADKSRDLDSALGCTPRAPLIDPTSCGTVRPHSVDQLAQPESGYPAVEVKAMYGGASTFATAWGRSRFAASSPLAGD